jgi:uncharacterized protein (DUF1778 family)
MARTIAKERTPARMPTAMYDRLVETALEKANAILEDERTIKLSSAAANEVFSLMENPPEPNEHLKYALQRRKETVCSK